MARGRTKQANPKNDNGANLGCEAQTFLAADKLCKYNAGAIDSAIALARRYPDFLRNGECRLK